MAAMGSKQLCAVGTGTAYELSMRPSSELAYCFAELIITAHQAATLSECDGERIVRVFVARGPPFAADYATFYYTGSMTASRTLRLFSERSCTSASGVLFKAHDHYTR